MDWKRIDELSSRHRAKIITVVAVSGTLALFIVGRELLGTRRHSHKARPRAANAGGGGGGGGGGAAAAAGYYDHSLLRRPPQRSVPLPTSSSSNPPCWTGFRMQAAPPEPAPTEGLSKRLRLWLRRLHLADLGFLLALLGLCIYAWLSPRGPRYTYTYTFYPPFYQQEPEPWF